MNRAVAMALWVGIVLCARAQAVGLRSSALLTNGQRGEGTVDTVGRHLEKISVFAYHITEDGDVLPPSAWVPDVLDRLMSDPRGHLILVTVNNRVLGPDGKLTPFHGGDTVKEILSDPEKRSEHIRQLAELSRQAHGIELNYERFSPDMRDLFTDFVRDLRAAMPRGRKLSLVLQPKTNGANGSNGNAVDWRAVEPYADYMRIMAYYYSWSTSRHGPVAPMAILESLGKYALGDPDQRIPRHKVSIILSLWGWDWPMPEGTPGTLIQLARAREIAASHGVTPKRDPEEMSLNFLYTAGDGGTHEVWIDDFESIRARVELLQSLGMPRVDFWHLNTGDPPLWDFVAAETARVRRSGLDFDGDRLSDLAVFRPDGARWFVDTSHDGGTDLVRSYGKGSDVPVPADYDGDGAVDLAVFRASQGGWLVDLDGDGVSDRSATLGKSGDVPVPADYDGDGAADFAVFDPSAASWLVDSDFDGEPDVSPVYGMEGDVPTPGDYDGDGAAEFAVFRRATGTWFVDSDRNGGTDLAMIYGRDGDLPVAGDYDGDGATDLAVFRPSWGGWYVDTDRNGGTDLRSGLGQTGDVPVPGNHDGDGIFDFAVFRPAEARWYVDTNHRNGADLKLVYGKGGDVPLRENGWILDAMGLTP